MNTKFSSKKSELRFAQGFCGQISYHALGRAVLHLQLPCLNHLSNPVILDLDMLGSAVELGLGGQVNGTKVVAFKNRGMWKCVSHSLEHVA